MSNRRSSLFLMLFVLSALSYYSFAEDSVPTRIEGAARFIQYDTADHYRDIRRLSCAGDPNEFYDSDIYIDEEENTWLACLEYLPGDNAPGQDRICLRKNEYPVQNLLDCGSYSTPSIAKVDANGAWITYEVQDQLSSQWEINLIIPDANGIYSNPITISSGIENCINHNVAADPNGNIWVVWQEDNGGQYDIMTRRILSTGYLDPIHIVSTNPRGDWRPDVGVTDSGKVCFVWDSYFDDAAFDPLLTGYAYDSFNVLARWYNPGADDWSNLFIFPHPTDPHDSNVQMPSAFQGYAHVVADPNDGDAVWVLWEEGCEYWGKDLYLTPVPVEDDPYDSKASWGSDIPGPLHNYRKLRIGKLINEYSGTRFYETSRLPMDSFDASAVRTDDPNHLRHGVFYEKGKLVFDRDGRLWVFYRHFYNNYCKNENIFQSMFESGWKIYGCYLDGSIWSDLYAFEEASIPDPNACWKLDENLKDSIGDKDGSWNDSDSSGPAYFSDSGHMALYFDGVNDYVEITDYTGITGSDARTLSVWIKAARNDFVQSIAQWGSDVSGQLWMLELRGDGRAAISVYGAGIISETIVADSQWHHIAAVLAQGQTDPADIKLYIDGKSDEGTRVSGPQISTASTEVHLGAFKKFSDDQAVYFFNGLLDDIRIYDQVLTHDQICQLFGFNNAHIRDGMQRLSVAAGADDIKLVWTVGRTDHTSDPSSMPGKDQINPAQLRGVVRSDIDISSCDSFQDPNLVLCVDPNVMLFDDPYSITEPNIISVGELDYRLVMGDLHRHTDLSLCQVFRDGTLEDAYRYGIEVAELNYLTITDHDVHLDGGRLSSQVWWRNCKEATRHKLNDTFFPLYGYETDYGGGHLDIISLDANRLKLVKVPDDDTGFMERVGRDGRAFAVPHALGNRAEIPRDEDYTKNHSYDHYRNLWEIYEGVRDVMPEPPFLSRQEMGIQDGLKTGQYFGVVASSDHVSTHHSFACIWTRDVSAEGIFEAMRTRRTYAATDKIVLDFRLNDHLMGDRFVASNVPEFYVKIESQEGYLFGGLNLVYGKVNGSDPNCEPIDTDKLGEYCTLNELIEGSEDLVGGLTDGSEYYFYVQAIEDPADYESNRAWSSPIWFVYDTNSVQPVHYWTFNEKMEDEGIAMNHGICFGDPQWADDESGKAISLDGTDDYVKMAGSTGVCGSNPRTCTARIKTTSSNGNPIIMSWGKGVGGATGYQYNGQKWMFALTDSGNFRVAVWGGYIDSGKFGLNDGNWHHVAAVVPDKNNPTVGDILLYIDGELEPPGNCTYINGAQIINTANTENISIGARFADGVSPIYMDGLIDDVRIYDRALTQAQIQALPGVGP